MPGVEINLLLRSEDKAEIAAHYLDDTPGREVETLGSPGSFAEAESKNHRFLSSQGKAESSS